MGESNAFVNLVSPKNLRGRHLAFDIGFGVQLKCQLDI
jgi:hypothetical protein